LNAGSVNVTYKASGFAAVRDYPDKAVPEEGGDGGSTMGGSFETSPD